MDVDDHDFGGPSSLAGVVTPGEVITSAKEFMRFVLPSSDVWMLMKRGHGTYVEDESVVSSVTGTIEKVNKLISVRALKARCVFLQGSEYSD
jgi:exosome complex component RRP4